MIIRRACADDAVDMAIVVSRSITELCVQEYLGDPEILERWLANKKVPDFQRWIADEKRLVVVAEELPAILGVGMMTGDGEVVLNFVSPEHRFRGVSKALVHEMETHARRLGLRRTRLYSAQAAKPFYASLGYETLGEAESRFGTLPAVVMQKTLND